MVIKNYRDAYPGLCCYIFAGDSVNGSSDNQIKTIIDTLPIPSRLLFLRELS